LKDARDKYSDEIPVEIVNSLTPYYKCRKGWFVAVQFMIHNLRRYQLPDEVIAATDEFNRRFIGEDWVRRLTTKEDIDFANQVLDKVIVFLENTEPES